MRLLHDQLQWDYGDGYGAAIKPADDLVYNADGQVIRDMNGDHLTYNDLGQMSAYQGVGQATSTTYAYDADGAQVRESAPHQAPLYKFYSGGDALTLAVQAGSDGKQHTTSLRGAYHYVDGKVSEIFESGLNGSVAGILSPAGKLTEQVLYTPYGLRSEMPASKAMVSDKTSLPALLHNTTWSFDGQVTDQPTGYQLLGKGYRGYNPKLRRFMQHDVASPFGVGGMNGYAYVGNNPIMHTDPTGHGYRDEGARELGRDFDELVGGLVDGIGLGMGGSGFFFGVVGLLAASASFVSGGGAGMAIGIAILASTGLNFFASLVGAASGGTSLAAKLIPNISNETKENLGKSAIYLGLGASALSIIGIVSLSASTSAAMVRIGLKLGKGGGKVFKSTSSAIITGVAFSAGESSPVLLEGVGMFLSSWALARPDQPLLSDSNYALFGAGVVSILAGLVTAGKAKWMMGRITGAKFENNHNGRGTLSFSKDKPIEIADIFRDMEIYNSTHTSMTDKARADNSIYMNQKIKKFIGANTKKDLPGDGKFSSNQYNFIESAIETHTRGAFLKKGTPQAFNEQNIMLLTNYKKNIKLDYSWKTIWANGNDEIGGAMFYGFTNKKLNENIDFLDILTKKMNHLKFE